MAASGVKPEQVNDKNSVPFIISGLCAILVAGMMRHMFAAAGIDSALKGLVSSFGIGLVLGIL
jgi:hypothetical protein